MHKQLFEEIKSQPINLKPTKSNDRSSPIIEEISLKQNSHKKLFEEIRRKKDSELIYITDSYKYEQSISFKKTEKSNLDLEIESSLTDETKPIFKEWYDLSHKEVNEYKLIFPHQCCRKGCRNIPDFKEEELKGDLYFCQTHRKEMVTEIKSKMRDIKIPEIRKYLDYMQESDYFLLEENKKYDEDWFEKEYAFIQVKLYEITQNIKKTSYNDSYFWKLLADYKLLKKTGNFIYMIKKLCNPNPLLFIGAGIALVIFGGLFCLGEAARAYDRSVCEQRMKEEDERINKIRRNRDEIDEFIRMIDFEICKNTIEALKIENGESESVPNPSVFTFQKAMEFINEDENVKNLDEGTTDEDSMKGIDRVREKKNFNRENQSTRKIKRKYRNVFKNMLLWWCMWIQKKISTRKLLVRKKKDVRM